MRKIYDEMLGVEPKLKESEIKTGAKKVERGYTEQEKNISRTLKQTTSEYQQAKAPTKQQTFSEIHSEAIQKAGKTTQEVESKIDNISKLATERKIASNSQQALLEEINKRTKYLTQDEAQLRQSKNQRALNDLGTKKAYLKELELIQQGEVVS